MPNYLCIYVHGGLGSQLSESSSGWITWSTDPEPGNGLVGVPPPVLHDVAPNQWSSPAQSGFAVNGDSTWTKNVSQQQCEQKKSSNYL